MTQDFGPTIFTNFLCDFMEESVQAGKPFLAYYPMVAPHGTREGHTTCPIYGTPGEMAGPKDDIPQRFRALNDYIDILMARLGKQLAPPGRDALFPTITCRW